MAKATVAASYYYLGAETVFACAARTDFSAPWQVLVVLLYWVRLFRFLKLVRSPIIRHNFLLPTLIDRQSEPLTSCMKKNKPFGFTHRFPTQMKWRRVGSRGERQNQFFREESIHRLSLYSNKQEFFQLSKLSFSPLKARGPRKAFHWKSFVRIFGVCYLMNSKRWSSYSLQVEREKIFGIARLKGQRTEKCTSFSFLFEIWLLGSSVSRRENFP